jgi:hydrogenase maturation protein HypF
MTTSAVTKRSDQPRLQRLRVAVRGAVQGVGFRPFVYRLADEMGLHGWVNNSPQGVFIEVEGPEPELQQFLLRLADEQPPRAYIQSLESTFLDAAGYEDFRILESDDKGEKNAFILPDVAVCDECLAEMADPTDRRYLYPFTNCTNCGPRYSIIESLPYDRGNTTMKRFEMCPECAAEYEDPSDRRFHAQPNACGACGPHVELWDASGTVLEKRHDAISAAAGAIRAGRIVAVKGLGGFHLVCDARNDAAVHTLRHRKHREEKPLALMFPNLYSLEEVCEVGDIERRLLTASERPIVLLKKRHNADAAELSHHLAPRNPYLGAMLPYTPMHYLLLAEFRFPIVATSGNLSDEPICIDEREALARLHGIANLFLVHDRPIARQVDDSVVRVMMGREMMVRRARGFAPLPVTVDEALPPTLSVGAHLKSAVALATGHEVFVSQHIGDLETSEAFAAFGKVIGDLEMLYEVEPEVTVCDRHPDYVSTTWAAEHSERPERVQHHYAHVLSCMAENRVAPPALGVAWDGTGFGDDGTIWGGEFLAVDDEGYKRVGSLRTFRLPGGDAAVKEPRRSAIGLLHAVFGDGVFDMKFLPPVHAFGEFELQTIRSMLANRVNSPRTSSAGRLFDAVSAMIGLSEKCRFEGQGAMELEFAAGEHVDSCYGFEVDTELDDGRAVIDWELMVRSIVSDMLDGMTPAVISARFHNTLVEMIVDIAERAAIPNVALSGGCFQNKYLTEHTIRRLRESGFNAYWHQRVPTNDGGIALGQTIAAARSLAKTNERRPEPVCA